MSERTFKFGERVVVQPQSDPDKIIHLIDRRGTVHSFEYDIGGHRGIDVLLDGETDATPLYVTDLAPYEETYTKPTVREVVGVVDDSGYLLIPDSEGETYTFVGLDMAGKRVRWTMAELPESEETQG